MAVTVRDVEGLEERLLEAGRELRDSSSSLLADAARWYENEAEPQGILDRQTFAHLCEVARSSTDEKVRLLATGTLTVLKRDSEQHADRARFVSRFALRRLCVLTGSNFGWSGLPIPHVEAEEAKELFDVARTDTRYSDETLLTKTDNFIQRHENSGDLFGRFAQDLEILVDVLTNPATIETHQDLARAALVYFVDPSDAISDDIGPVGLLDDAFIVRRAIEQIQPRRSIISSHLDTVVRDWPFLRDLALGANGELHRLSEFMIINTGLVLLESESNPGDSRGSVVVTSESGPLPFLVGFIRALAEVHSFIDESGRPAFRQGERLAERESGAEVVFHSYGRLEGSAFKTCGPGEASYFQVCQPGKGGFDILRTKPIRDLLSLRRSTKDSGPLRGGSLTLEADATKLGPLEQTFSSVLPIVVPPSHGQVIVVAPLKTSKELARSLTLHGKPLTDALPMGQARVDEDQIVSTEWTKGGPGGDPLLCVVRSSAEAVELAERAERPILAVVSGIRPRHTDAVNLRRLAADGVPVLAVAEALDEESLETFQKGQFRFWAWDEEWLSYLRWPQRGTKLPSHPVAACEHRLRKQASASVAVVDLDLPPLDDAKRSLDRLDQLRHEREDEVLEAAVREGFTLLVALCRKCGNSMEDSIQSLERFRIHARSGTQWWSDDVVAASKSAEASLEAALEVLRKVNPKHDFLVSWAADNPAGVVVRRRELDASASVPTLSGVNWIQGRPPSAFEGPLLISAWMGRPTMERLLVPPTAQSTTLALYGPERDWYRLFIGRQSRVSARTRQMVRERSPIPLPSAPDPELSPPVVRVEEPLVDEIVDSVRRAQILRRLGTGEPGEEVAARLVYFTGGHWAPFGPDHSVNTVTHLRGVEIADAKDALRSVTVSDLRTGDLVVMVRGSDRDALRHAADQELPEGARETAAVWRAALRRFVEAGHSPTELRRRLAREGCHRTAVTVRSWLKDDRLIGPKDALDGALEAIQRATEDDELQKKVEACKEAIHQVRSAHFAVAFRLATQVLDRTREWLDIDTPPDQLVEVEERLVLLTVDSVDSELAKVPRSALNRLREEAS